MKTKIANRKVKQQVAALLLVDLVALTFLPAAAQACDSGGVSSEYVAAIEARNLEKMSALMSDDISYQDPTMAFFGQGPIDLKGSQATRQFWSEAYNNSHTQQLIYKIDQCFVAGPEVLLNMTFRLKVAGQAWGINHPTVELELRHVMSLRIEKGKIAQHIDYVDYQAMSDQTSALKTQYGTVN